MSETHDGNRSNSFSEDLAKNCSGDAVADRNRTTSLPNSELAKQRETLARNFIRERQGNVDDCLKGIDFSKDVRIETLKPGTIVYRCQPPTDAHGRPQIGPEHNRGESPRSTWFQDGRVPLNQLGIEGISAESKVLRGKLDTYVVTREIQVLRSTAKDIPSFRLPEDKQGKKPPSGELFYGGGEQIFAGNRPEDKAAFSRIVDRDRLKKQ